MEKITKKYIEYLYPDLLCHKITMEIKHNNPMKVNVIEPCVGFRFYEKEIVINGKKRFKSKPKNITNWFYIGKRFTFDEVQRCFGNNLKFVTLINNMKGNNISSICMTEYGSFIPMKAGDMTLEEYIAEHSKEEKETVNPTLSLKQNN